MDEAAEVAREEAAGFEFGVVGGQVTNSQFTRERLGGLVIGHGLRPHLGLAAQVTWSPDFGARDLTELTRISVHVGQSDISQPFVQPVDKQAVAVSLALTETAHGEIGWFAGRALPISVGGLVGGGVLVKRNSLACEPWGIEDAQCPGDPSIDVVVANYVGDEIKPALAIGGQFALHLSASWAVRLDVRDHLYVDRPLDYDPFDDDAVLGHQLVSDLVATVGLVWFVPRLADARWKLPDIPEPSEGAPPLVAQRDLARGLFLRGGLGRAAYLGRYGSTPYGPILQPGTSVALGFGGDHRVAASSYAVAWEIQGSTSAHGGLHWALIQQGIGSGEIDPEADLQGDTRTASATAIGTLNVAPVPRLDLGLRLGGGVMVAPLLIPPFNIGGSRRPPFRVHRSPHPVVLVGPTFQLRTGVEGLAVGMNADFVYAAGFDYGVNVGGFAKVTLR